jgi:uncharacterized lipoprotein YajG
MGRFLALSINICGNSHCLMPADEIPCNELPQRIRSVWTSIRCVFATITQDQEPTMNRILLLTCLLLLSACGKQPVIANLNPNLGDQPPGIYQRGTSAVITGQDARKSTEVVIFQNDEPPSRLANVSAPADLIAARLGAGLRDQGLVIEPSAPVRLKFVINELLVQVTRKNLRYTAEGKTHIVLTVENRGTVFTRVFKREAYNDSATRPDLPDLEKMLNTQLADIGRQILQDEEIRQLIGRK